MGASDQGTVLRYGRLWIQRRAGFVRGRLLIAEKFTLSRLLVFGILFAFVNLFSVSSADKDLRLPRVVVASGGPYIAAAPVMESFRDSISIPYEYLTQPLSMVCTNGTEKEPGFSWVRLFLLPDKSDSDLQAVNQPVGRLLLDENSFLYSAQVYLDMTGQLRPGSNRIIVEGAGRPGARFSFEIRSIGKPQLYMPDTVAAESGTFLDIYGSGFSLRPDENTVQLGSIYLSVGSSSGSNLRVFIPKDFPSGTYDLCVAIRNYRSRSVRVQVLSPKK